MEIRKDTTYSKQWHKVFLPSVAVFLLLLFGPPLVFPAMFPWNMPLVLGVFAFAWWKTSRIKFSCPNCGDIAEKYHNSEDPHALQFYCQSCDIVWDTEFGRTDAT